MSIQEKQIWNHSWDAKFQGTKRYEVEGKNPVDSICKHKRHHFGNSIFLLLVSNSANDKPPAHKVWGSCWRVVKRRSNNASWLSPKMTQQLVNQGLILQAFRSDVDAVSLTSRVSKLLTSNASSPAVSRTASNLSNLDAESIASHIPKLKVFFIRLPQTSPSNLQSDLSLPGTAAGVLWPQTAFPNSIQSKSLSGQCGEGALKSSSIQPCMISLIDVDWHCANTKNGKLQIIFEAHRWSAKWVCSLKNDLCWAEVSYLWEQGSGAFCEYLLRSPMKSVCSTDVQEAGEVISQEEGRGSIGAVQNETAELRSHRKWWQSLKPGCNPCCARQPQTVYQWLSRRPASVVKDTMFLCQYASLLSSTLMTCMPVKTSTDSEYRLKQEAWEF